MKRVYILVQAGTRKGAHIVAIAASENIDSLKDFAVKDAAKEFGIHINGDWNEDQIFPYVILPGVSTQYYIREIEYLD